jgi:hypothetical protein
MTLCCIQSPPLPLADADGHFRCWCRRGSLIHPDDRPAFLNQTALWSLSPELASNRELVLRVSLWGEGGGITLGHGCSCQAF